MFDAPVKVAALMRGFEEDWCVAGGWAIDLYLDAETRPHEDVEIAIFRRDQTAVQKYLAGWRLLKAENGELSVWSAGEFLELPIHAIHCFNEESEPGFLEILLNESENARWLYRRNRQISVPLSETALISKTGISFLRPEIVLLYKSKNPRAKDQQDFQNVVNYLNDESKKWLRDALLSCYPQQHHWLQKL